MRRERRGGKKERKKKCGKMREKRRDGREEMRESGDEKRRWERWGEIRRGERREDSRRCERRGGFGASRRVRVAISSMPRLIKVAEMPGQQQNKHTRVARCDAIESGYSTWAEMPENKPGWSAATLLEKGCSTRAEGQRGDALPAATN